MLGLSLQVYPPCAMRERWKRDMCSIVAAFQIDIKSTCSVSFFFFVSFSFCNLFNEVLQGSMFAGLMRKT